MFGRHCEGAAESNLESRIFWTASGFVVRNDEVRQYLADMTLELFCRSPDKCFMKDNVYISPSILSNSL
jgi:hypothetical protein